LLGVHALGDTTGNLARSIRLADTHREFERQPHDQPVAQLVTQPDDVTQPHDESHGQPGPHRCPGHRRRWHGRIPALSAVRARPGGDPGRRRGHRLPQKDHQEPLTHAAAGLLVNRGRVQFVIPI